MEETVAVAAADASAQFIIFERPQRQHSKHAPVYTANTPSSLGLCCVSTKFVTRTISNDEMHNQ